MPRRHHVGGFGNNQSMVLVNLETLIFKPRVYDVVSKL